MVKTFEAERCRSIAPSFLCAIIDLVLLAASFSCFSLVCKVSMVSVLLIRGPVGGARCGKTLASIAVIPTKSTKNKTDRVLTGLLVCWCYRLLGMISAKTY